jgi:tetrahydromethanopterin S-methyltransferase subunit G
VSGVTREEYEGMDRRVRELERKVVELHAVNERVQAESNKRFTQIMGIMVVIVVLIILF